MEKKKKNVSHFTGTPNSMYSMDTLMKEEAFIFFHNLKGRHLLLLLVLTWAFIHFSSHVLSTYYVFRLYLGIEEIIVNFTREQITAAQMELAFWSGEKNKNDLKYT